MKKALVIKPATALNGEINVTPLVDVVLVLLIIFMVVTPLLEKDIHIALPSTEKVEEIKDVPPDQLLVRLTAEGDIDVNGTKTPPEQLVQSLKDRLAMRADKTVFIVADDKANYSKLVYILDGAKNAGAVTLGMATDPSASTTQ